MLSLRKTDFDPTAKQVVYRRTKGKAPRTAPLSDTAVEIITRWLTVRPDCDTDLIYISNTGGALNPDAWGRLFAKYVEFAGVPKFSAHGLRHFAATELAKVNLWAAQTILGHKSSATTQIYLHTDSDHVREAHNQAAPLAKILIERRDPAAQPARRKRLRL